MSRKLTGWLGIVLLPDLRTAEAATELATQFTAGQYFWFSADAPVLPVTLARAHVTVYQCKKATIDPEEVVNTLQAVRTLVARDRVELVHRKIGVQHGQYLFWHTDMTPLVRKIHDTVLVDAQDWTTSKQHAAVLRDYHERRIPLSAEETSNVHEYGQRYVRRLYMPHTTLAYTPGQFTLRLGSVRSRLPEHPHRGFARAVALCSHSDGGRIEEVICEMPLV